MNESKSDPILTLKERADDCLEAKEQAEASEMDKVDESIKSEEKGKVVNFPSALNGAEWESWNNGGRRR